MSANPPTTAARSADDIGIDLGGTKCLLVSGRHSVRLATGSGFGPADLQQAVADFVREHRLSPACIGLAVPGLVGADGQVLACDVLPRLEGWRPAQALAGVAGRVACSVTVANDVRAALAEELHDAPAGCTAGVVMVGTAVGAAFVADGRPLRGASGFAGELGYLPILSGGRVQRLDDLAGGAALASACGLAPAQLAAQAASGVPTVAHAVAAAGHALGLGLAAVINLFNPSRLAVGGGTWALPGYRTAALASAQAHALPALWRDCRMSEVRAGPAVAALGALRLARATPTPHAHPGDTA